MKQGRDASGQREDAVREKYRRIPAVKKNERGKIVGRSKSWEGVG